MSNGGTRRVFACRGFTLIELLVVVAIVAMLMAILMPSLQMARRSARASACGTNLHHVSMAMSTYLSEMNAAYPPSYFYPSGPNGEADFMNQSHDKKYGYVHWSWFLYSGGRVDTNAFECPEHPHGGTPRTNPGPDPSNWETQDNQRDDGGLPGLPARPYAPVDKQAPRMAFTANAAIIPRNKFTQEDHQGGGGSLRLNRIVQEHEITRPRGTILVTELNTSWKATAVPHSGGLRSKSHRPVNPFYHFSVGSDEYRAPLTKQAGFTYGIGSHPTYGLLPAKDLKERVGIIDDDALIELNVIGRHHPGGDEWGGTTNFLYVDGSVQRKSVLETLEQREWGDRYYSLRGPNEVWVEDWE
ncbi:MAG: type II secretion system GspH family protein [Planctomycetes bacterium]|nr:type II secretion system GspH family protein [Planctomycetota bacterium]